jgi:predicted dehydrogenase
MMTNNRRTFLGTTAAAAMTWKSRARAAGANERMRIGLIGCGGRGRFDASLFSVRDDAEVAYVADPHQHRLAVAAKQFGSTALVTGDFRKILDDQSIDAVIVATPVHWHAPATILACEAGKHVYVEKPCSHNIHEGRLLVEAARRNHCVVQHGTQVRSTSTIAEGVRLLRDGLIGEVLVSKAWNIQRRAGGGPALLVEPPPELDYDMWLGPVPPVPYHDTLFSKWNWLQHFGTGEIGNDGIHDIDYARWGLGVESHPTFVAAAGGRYFYDDEAEFPDTQQVNFEYPATNNSGKKRLLIYEERLWSTNYPHQCDSGVEFYGTQGQMFMSRRGKLQVRLDRNKQHALDVPLVPQDTAAHVADFLNAIRTDRRPNADAEIAHLTTSLCHLGNLSIRLGRALNFDPQQETFINDTEADTFLGRTYQDNHWAAPRRIG